jgi:hypothetical protein
MFIYIYELLIKTHLHHSLPEVFFFIIFFLDFNEFCLEDNESGYTWEKTPVGTSVIKKCPAGTIGAVFLTICVMVFGFN